MTVGRAALVARPFPVGGIKMRVCMKASLSGTRDGAPWPAVGETVDLPKDEAEHLVEAGLAESAAGSAPVEEQAVAQGEPEKAVPARKPRGKS